MPDRTGMLSHVLYSFLRNEGVRINQKRKKEIDETWEELRTPQINLTVFKMLEMMGQPEPGDDDYESFDGEENHICYIEYDIMCLEYNGSLFGFTYDDDGCELVYKSRYEERKAIRLRVILYNAAKECKKQLSETIKEKLVNKNIAIRNEFVDDLDGLYWLGKEIEKQYSSYVRGNGPNELEEEDQECFENDFLSPSEAEYEFLLDAPYDFTLGKRASKIKISMYIQAAFSFIEHCSMCLLPLWESDNTRQWEILKSKAKYFVPETWTTFLLHKDDRLQDFMDLVEDVFHEDNRDLYFEYRTAKTDLRNVEVHGHVTSMQMENLTFCVPSMNPDGDLDMEPSLNEISFFSYTRVRHLVNSFLDYLKRINPVHYAILSSGLDIPGDCSELLSFVNNDIEKYKVFMDRWEKLRYQMDPWEC